MEREMKNDSVLRFLISAVSLALFISGCSGMKETVKREPFQYVKADETEESVKEDGNAGSIWRENEGLFSDRRAKKLNDIVTVRIVESSKASRKAATSTGRDTEMSGGVSSLFGLEGGFSNHRFNPGNMVDLSAGKSFKGSGATERSGDLTGTITAVVKEVYPNGLMRIEGRRVVTVNAEDQYLTLSGLVRHDDIAIDNSIFSTKIADAVIEYSGEGVIGREQKPGWLANAVDVIWPF